jgi:hypothetical protein
MFSNHLKTATSPKKPNKLIGIILVIGLLWFVSIFADPTHTTPITPITANGAANQKLQVGPPLDYDMRE